MEPSGDRGSDDTNGEHRRLPRIYLVSRQAIVHETVKSLKLKRVQRRKGSQLPPFDIGWVESADLSFYRQIRTHQRVSQMPGMEQLSRKKNLCRNLNAMRAVFPLDYDIFPKSWLIPEEYPSLIKYMEHNPNSVIIVKPDGRCQGRGIYLTSRCAEIDSRDNQVCQLYIERPFLINGFKFDLRLYSLITSIDPLRAFLYDDGLTRLCTQPYRAPCSGNFSSSFMHLTNYAINKSSDSYRFSQNENATDADSKWTVKSFFQWLESIHPGLNTVLIWSNIQEVIAKAIVAGSSSLRHLYRAHYPMPNNGALSFQLLGVDILLDENLRPWLIEINRNPSLKCDTALDHNVKSTMLRDLFAIILPELGNRSKSLVHNRLSGSACGGFDRATSIAQQSDLEIQRSQSGGFRLILHQNFQEGQQQDCIYSHFISENQRIFDERTKRKLQRQTST